MPNSEGAAQRNGPKIKCNRARVTIFAQHCCMNIRSEEVGQMHRRSKMMRLLIPSCVCYSTDMLAALAIYVIITMLSKVFAIFSLTFYFLSRVVQTVVVRNYPQWPWIATSPRV